MSEQQQDIWTILATLNWVQGYLAERGEANPRLAAQLLLTATTGLERVQLYTHFDQPLDSNQRQQLRQALRRRVAGEPLQYIAGKAHFRYLELDVNPSVLIPRPESETLVQLVLDWLRAKPLVPAAQILLDIGTGSGNIALALASELEDVQVLATDISLAALQTAQENAQSLNLAERVLFLQDDLAGKLLDDQRKLPLPPALAQPGGFVVLVSNPPYIPSGLLSALPREVGEFEPRLALDGGRDGLELFRRLAEQAAELLATGGLLALELHETRVQAATDFLKHLPFTDVQMHNDLNGRVRFLTALRSQ